MKLEQLLPAAAVINVAGAMVRIAILVWEYTPLVSQHSKREQGHGAETALNSALPAQHVM